MPLSEVNPHEPVTLCLVPLFSQLWELKRQKKGGKEKKKGIFD